MRLAAFAFFLLATPGLAEPFAGRGYLTGCYKDTQRSGCWIAAGELTLYAGDGEGTNAVTMHSLWSLSPVTAIEIKGDRGAISDGSASIALTDFTLVTNDPYQDTLRYLQGDWLPQGGKDAPVLRIAGLEWQEWTGGSQSARYRIIPSDHCAYTKTSGGTAISLAAIGGKAEVACWQIAAATASAIGLKDVTGTKGRIDYQRH